jgi:integrase
LSPDLAAGIRGVKGVKKLGCRLGNWLTSEQARALWQLPDSATLKGKRDRAILAVLLGCGLRRRELTELTTEHFQLREDHWAIVDLIGKGGHVRTVPVPTWVKQTVDDWLVAARVADGRLFRRVCRTGTLWGEEMTEKVGELEQIQFLLGHASVHVLNHTNFDQVGTALLFDPIHFGQVLSARDPRIIQLGLKLLF